MPKPLEKIIRRFMNVAKDPQRLLSTHEGKPITRNMLTKRLTKLFLNELNKRVSTQMLRTIFHTEANKEFKEARKKIEENAKIMGHSAQTAIKVYTKDSV